MADDTRRAADEIKDWLGRSETDLTEDQMEENRRLVEERLAREAAESARYLSGEKTLGRQFTPDNEVPFNHEVLGGSDPFEEDRRVREQRSKDGLTEAND